MDIIFKVKEHCEHLIVGVSTDEVIKDTKENSVIPFEENIGKKHKICKGYASDIYDKLLESEV